MMNLSFGAPFRINGPSTVGQKEATTKSDKPDEYLTRLIKLIPAEVLTLYLTFKESLTGFVGIWAVVCLGLVVFVRTIGTRQEGKPTQKPAVIIAAVSFILWIYATGGYFILKEFQPNAGVISATIGVWTFVIPYFYNPEDQK